jgi:hypothetical protein
MDNESNSLSIPVDNRYANLKAVLFGYVEQIATIRRNNRSYLDSTLMFLYLSYPWIVDQNIISAEQREAFEARKKEVEDTGFNGVSALSTMQEILKADSHLRECCANDISRLAHYLDMAFINPATITKKYQPVTQEQLDFAYKEFETSTYEQGRFRRLAATHLFNFEIPIGTLKFQSSDGFPGDITIERVHEGIIPIVLGEKSSQSFLHPRGIGEAFIVEEEGASELSDVDWLWAKRVKAHFFSQVLQYFKDGVVHLGYTSPVFKPNWVNDIRRSGLYFMGTARRTPHETGTKLYQLSMEEISRLSEWWKAATTKKVFDALEIKTGKLREAIYRAANYYEASHGREGNIEKLLALAISLESLFCPKDGELSFRISQSAAQFIGETPQEREEIFKHLKKMYGKRSALVHGSYDLKEYEEGTFVTTEEIERWSGYLRKALTGFMALYLKDKKLTRDDILNRITKTSFDTMEGDKLRVEADMLAFIQSVNAEQPDPVV